MDFSELVADLTRAFGFPVFPNPIACDGFPVDGWRGTGAGTAERGTLCVGGGGLWLNHTSKQSPTWCRVPGVRVKAVGNQGSSQDDNQGDKCEANDQSCSERTVTSGSPLTD